MVGINTCWSTKKIKKYDGGYIKASLLNCECEFFVYFFIYIYPISIANKFTDAASTNVLRRLFLFVCFFQLL